MAAKTQKVDFKSTEFQPKNEFVLVGPFELKKEETLASGIVVVNELSVTDRPTSGEVIAVGKDIDDIDVGSVILWPNTDGIDLEFTDGVKTLLRYKSIIGGIK